MVVCAWTELHILARSCVNQNSSAWNYSRLVQVRLLVTIWHGPDYRVQRVGLPMPINLCSAPGVTRLSHNGMLLELLLMPKILLTLSFAHTWPIIGHWPPPHNDCVVNSDLAIQLPNHAELIDMLSITLPVSLVEEISRCENFSHVKIPLCWTGGKLYCWEWRLKLFQ